MTQSFSSAQRNAIQEFGNELEQFQQQLQSKCYQVAQTLDPQSSSIISKSYDSATSLKSQAAHAQSGRPGSSLSGSPVEQLQQMLQAVQEDIAQAVNWTREAISQS